MLQLIYFYFSNVIHTVPTTHWDLRFSFRGQYHEDDDGHQDVDQAIGCGRWIWETGYSTRYARLVKKTKKIISHRLRPSANA